MDNDTEVALQTPELSSAEIGEMAHELHERIKGWLQSRSIDESAEQTRLSVKDMLERRPDGTVFKISFHERLPDPKSENPITSSEVERYQPSQHGIPEIHTGATMESWTDPNMLTASLTEGYGGKIIASDIKSEGAEDVLTNLQSNTQEAYEKAKSIVDALTSE